MSEWFVGTCSHTERMTDDERATEWQALQTAIRSHPGLIARERFTEITLEHSVHTRLCRPCSPLLPGGPDGPRGLGSFLRPDGVRAAVAR